MLEERINHLRSICQQNAVDAFLISSTSNVFYLTGFADFIAEEREGFVFVTKNNLYLLTSPLYADAVTRIAPQVTLLVTTGQKWYTEHLKEIIARDNIKSIGFEDIDLRYIEYEEFYSLAELVPFTLRGFRKIKDAQEVAAIQKACTLADALFDHTLSVIKPGVSEKEVALEMELFVRKNHAYLSFPSIVAFGENAAAIHHVPTDKKLQNGEFVLLDFGTKVDEYCSDMGRTLFVGNPTEEQKHMYTTVKDAQQKAIEYVQEQWDKGNRSIVTHDIDAVARSYVTSHGYPEFPFAVGHGVGLEVHESPTLSRNAKETLEVGSIYTLEPGIHYPQHSGIRIEDMFALTEKGPVQLTHSTKDLVVL